MRMQSFQRSGTFHEFITNSGHLADTYGFHMSSAIVNDLVIKKIPCPY